jgi:hypothetical protein
MSTIRITCINKDGGNHLNRHEGISHLGYLDQNGTPGKCTRSELIKWLREGNKAYVEDTSRNVAYIGIFTSVYGTEYVATLRDGKPSDNLLSLPECR